MTDTATKRVADAIHKTHNMPEPKTFKDMAVAAIAEYKAYLAEDSIDDSMDQGSMIITHIEDKEPMI